MFIVEKNICLILVPKILPQSIMWVTTTDRTRATLSQTLIRLNEGSTQTSHGAIKIRINMLKHPMDRKDMFNHLDFISKIKCKEALVMTNLAPLNF